VNVLKPIRNHVLFQFEDPMIKHMGVRQFESRTEWGFAVFSADESAKDARFGLVVAVGPEVPEEIRPGVRILIEPLKWTPAIPFEGEEYWRTDSDCILAVDEDTIIQ